jgi:hydroxyethylthiazole kinase-like sugar kinase family protein
VSTRGSSGQMSEAEVSIADKMQITNNVVINQSANATLALGASPIMATAWQEMEDLAKIPGGLLINFGTIADKQGMLDAGQSDTIFES